MRARSNIMQMPSMGNLRLRQPMQGRQVGGQRPGFMPPLPQMPMPPSPPAPGGAGVGAGGGNGVGKGGRLTAAQRRALPDSAFAGPNRSFPITDKGHAKAAKALIKNAPPSARAKITARADAKLGKTASSSTKKRKA